MIFAPLLVTGRSALCRCLIYSRLHVATGRSNIPVEFFPVLRLVSAVNRSFGSDKFWEAGGGMESYQY